MAGVGTRRVGPPNVSIGGTPSGRANGGIRCSGEDSGAGRAGRVGNAPPARRAAMVRRISSWNRRVRSTASGSSAALRFACLLCSSAACRSTFVTPRAIIANTTIAMIGPILLRIQSMCAPRAVYFFSPLSGFAIAARIAVSDWMFSIL